MSQNVKFPPLSGGGGGGGGTSQHQRFRSMSLTKNQPQSVALQEGEGKQKPGQPESQKNNFFNISGAKSSTENVKVHEPFKIPTDNEVFDYCEAEKNRKMEARREVEAQKVWQKTTYNTQRALKHFKSFESSCQLDPKHLTQTKLKKREERSVSMALNIINERKSVRENQEQHSEKLTDLLEQKKEMFLVTMAHGIIEKEIQKLQQISEDKNKALKQSEEMLVQDQENFQKYLEQNEQERVAAEQKAESMAKAKRAREATIKQMHVQQTQIRTETIRNEDIVEKCKNLRVFLDGMANKEWQDERQRRLDEYIERFKGQWIESRLREQDDQLKDKKSVAQHQVRSQLKNQRTNAELEREYYQLVREERIDEVNHFNDSLEMYFKYPEQLNEYFENLEEKNLFLIQMGQEELQKLQEFDQQFRRERAEIDSKLGALQEQQKTLLRQKQDLERDLRSLQRKNETNRNIIDDENKEIKHQIMEIFNIFRQDINVVDAKHMDSKGLLTEVEIYLDRMIKELLEQDREQVRELQKRVEGQRKKILREAQQLRLKEEQERKDKKNIDKIMQPSKKREGRLDMLRSAPVEKIVVKVERVVDNADEEDKKYFREDFNLTYEETIQQE